MTDPDFTPGIPREFWSEYLERPFETCIQCDAGLMADDWTGYVLQKHVVAGETVFEMAICMDCARGLQEEFSEQSIRSMTQFLREAPVRRRRQSDEESPGDPFLLTGQRPDAPDESFEQRLKDRQQQALSCCAICEKSRDACHRYSIGTACLARGMLTALPGPNDLGSPFLICEDCETALNECISTQTRDSWNRFVEDNFDGPPGITVDPHELTLIF